MAFLWYVVVLFILSLVGFKIEMWYYYVPLFVYGAALIFNWLVNVFIKLT